jgi:hypothetical protein
MAQISDPGIANASDPVRMAAKLNDPKMKAHPLDFIDFDILFSFRRCSSNTLH